MTIFKVLVANPMRSTIRMKEFLLLKESALRLINLSPSNLMPMEISSRVVENYFIRSSTPVPPLPNRGALELLAKEIMVMSTMKGGRRSNRREGLVFGAGGL